MTSPLAWPASKVHGDLPLDEAHVWAWALDPLPVDVAAHVALLDDAERERMQRFHFARDRTRYALAHGNLRRILGAYLDQAPETIAFRTHSFGKPELVHAGLAPSLSFNLSHSRTIAALAIVREGPVGVDVEDVRPIEPEVAASHFSTAELAELNQLREDAWLRGFYRCWTRKEAILKAEGVGLQRALNAFDVSLSLDTPPALLGSRIPLSNPWKLYDVSPAHDTAGALATARSYTRLSLHSYLP